MQYIFFHINLVLKTFSHEQMQMQNMLTALQSFAPVGLSALTLVNISHRVRTDTLPRCLCEGEIGKQD